MAARRRNTFLIHSWWLGDASRRLVIEHVQSGERIAVASLAAALDWLVARDTANDPTTATATGDDPTNRPPRTEPDG
jgi:hypothetical protein